MLAALQQFAARVEIPVASGVGDRAFQNMQGEFGAGVDGEGGQAGAGGPGTGGGGSPPRRGGVIEGRGAPGAPWNPGAPRSTAPHTQNPAGRPKTTPERRPPPP